MSCSDNGASFGSKINQLLAQKKKNTCMVLSEGAPLEEVSSCVTPTPRKLGKSESVVEELNGCQGFGGSGEEVLSGTFSNAWRVENQQTVWREMHVWPEL